MVMLASYIFDGGAQMHGPGKPERQDGRAGNEPGKEPGKAIKSNKRARVQNASRVRDV
jgi:hypothetical protein